MNDGRSISVASISQDSFYRDLNPEQMILAKKSEYNFDHPDTIDDDEIFRNLDFLLRIWLDFGYSNSSSQEHKWNQT